MKLLKTKYKGREKVFISYIVIMLSITLMVGTTAYRIKSYNAETKAKIEEIDRKVAEMEQSELIAALNGVTMHSGSKNMVLKYGYFYPDYINDVESARYKVYDLLFDFDKTTISFYIDVNGTKIDYLWSLKPSDIKFRHTIVDVNDNGREYNIYYTKADLESGTDSIFDFLDYNNDGKINLEYFERHKYSSGD